MKKYFTCNAMRLALVGSSLCLLVTVPTFSQVRDTYEDWQVVCDLEGCTMLQALRNPAKPSITYSSEIKFVEASPNPVIHFNFPLGIYLPPGVGLEVGTLRKDIPVAVCLPRGCQAILALDQGLIGALGSQSVFRVRFYTEQSTPNEVEFSLNGFGEAYQTLLERR